MQTRSIEQINRLKDLYTPVVADALDKLGYRNQSLRSNIRPLYPEARLAGFAMTVQTVPAMVMAPANPYQGELRAVDALQENDIMVVSHCDWSFWGELLSTAARYRGCQGILIDGFTRDAGAIIDMKFPVFSRGLHPADSLGRIDVSAHNVPIRCGDVPVGPNDLVLADLDGAVIIPQEIAEKALTMAEEKAGDENVVREKLAQGMLASEAFEKYGVL